MSVSLICLSVCLSISSVFFFQDGPLDLRFDQTKGVSAYEYLKTVEREELVRVLTLYGDGTDTEAVARRIADAICIKRAEEGEGGAGGIPTRTRELAPPLLLLLPFPSCLPARQSPL